MFLGKTYRKPSAWDGILKIGVAKTEDGQFAPHWQTSFGNTGQLHNELLPEVADPQTAQLLLDTWASEKQLEAA